MQANLFQMYQNRYPSLFAKSHAQIQKRLATTQRSRSVPIPTPIPEEEPIKKVQFLDKEKVEAKKEEIIEVNPQEVKPQEKVQEAPKKTKPKSTYVKKRSQKEIDERNAKRKEELLGRLCKSKKLDKSEKVMEEINETLEGIGHDEEKLKEKEQEVRKKLKILKNSKLFLDKNKKD